ITASNSIKNRSGTKKNENSSNSFSACTEPFSRKSHFIATDASITKSFNAAPCLPEYLSYCQRTSFLQRGTFPDFPLPSPALPLYQDQHDSQAVISIQLVMNGYYLTPFSLALRPFLHQDLLPAHF